MIFYPEIIGFFKKKIAKLKTEKLSDLLTIPLQIRYN